MKSIFADADVEARFRRDGYVVQPLLSVEEIKALYDLHQSTTPNVPSDYYATPLSSDALYRETIRQGVNAILLSRLRFLMPNYYPCLSSYVVKRGNSSQGRVPLHQDYSMVDFDQHTAVHIWCPLIDVDETNGCLKAVAGSHKFFNHIVAVSGNPAPYDPLRKLLEEEYTVSVPMPAGSAFIFDQRLLHCSDENHTDTLRIAVGGIMIPKECAPLLYIWDKDKPEHLNVLEVSVDYLSQFKPGASITEPYPQGVKFLKTITNKVVPLTNDDITSLHPLGVKMIDTRKQSNIQLTNSRDSAKPDVYSLFSPSAKRNQWFSRLIAWLQR